MRIPVTDNFLAELERYALRFLCEDCLLHLGEGGCLHEWPDEDHATPPKRPGDEVVFCKEFELR